MPAPEGSPIRRKAKRRGASEDSRGTRSAWGVFHLYIAAHSSAEKHDVLLYIGGATAQTQARKRIETFNDLVFYFSTASLLHELRIRQNTACEKHPSGFEDFLLTEILLTETFWQPVK